MSFIDRLETKSPTLKALLKLSVKGVRKTEPEYRVMFSLFGAYTVHVAALTAFYMFSLYLYQIVNLVFSHQCLRWDVCFEVTTITF